MQKNKIGFIGIGVMGKSMADNLLKAGYDVMIYTRTKQKAESLLAKGAKWFDSAMDLAKKCRCNHLYGRLSSRCSRNLFR